MTKEEIRKKIEKYCAFQERSHKEVKDKLRLLGVNSIDSDRLIADLIQGGFINEERFAFSYARGKNRVKKWGINKVKHALKQKGIGNSLIEKALKQMDKELYLEQLKLLYQKKWHLIKNETPFEKSMKVKTFLMRKGYDLDDIDKVKSYFDQTEELKKDDK